METVKALARYLLSSWQDTSTACVFQDHFSEETLKGLPPFTNSDEHALSLNRRFPDGSKATFFMNGSQDWVFRGECNGIGVEIPLSGGASASVRGERVLHHFADFGPCVVGGTADVKTQDVTASAKIGPMAMRIEVSPLDEGPAFDVISDFSVAFPFGDKNLRVGVRAGTVQGTTEAASFTAGELWSTSLQYDGEAAALQFAGRSKLFNDWVGYLSAVWFHEARDIDAKIGVLWQWKIGGMPCKIRAGCGVEELQFFAGGAFAADVVHCNAELGMHWRGDGPRWGLRIDF